jgi:hypothetical protein
MQLNQLLEQLSHRPTTSVPDWMLGCFKRKFITFANGQTDTATQVFWLQSRNITIDLRLPISADQVAPKTLSDYSAQELIALANYEGWWAESQWQDNRLSWSGGCSLQLNNRWPEPAILSRVGNCMMEFSPSSAYVEDWRIQSRRAGPLLGMRLIDECDLATNEVRHRGGAFIVSGDWAGMVLGRASELPTGTANVRLRDVVKAAGNNLEFIRRAFNVETSIATGNLKTGYEVCHSTQPQRLAKPLFACDGFEFNKNTGEVIHHFEENGAKLKRRFTIDTLEANFEFSGSTKFTPKAAEWFASEQETLGRYLTEIR